MKKILGILLALAMVLSAVSFTAFAKDEYVAPACTITEITGEDLVLSSEEQFFGRDEIALDYALNFTAVDTVEDLATSPFADYLADFEITFSDDVQAVLAGQYDEFNPTWVVLDDISYGDFVAPAGGLSFNGGETVKIMKQFGESFAEPGKNPAFTYADCINWVKSFNCGVKVTTPKDVTITLALKLYETNREGTDQEGHVIYTPTGVEYTVFERTFEYDGAIDLDTVDGINDVVIGEDTSDETIAAVADAIAKLDAESAANVNADIIAAVAEDKGTFAAVPGTNDGLAINYVETETDNALLANGVVFDVTAEINGAPVDELAHPVLIKIPLSEIGLAADEKIEKIYHEHDDIIEELDFVVEGDYVCVKMIKFSLISIVKSVAPAAGSAVLQLIAAPAEAGKAAFDLLLTGDTADTVRNLSAGQFTITYPAGVNAKYDLVANNATDIYCDNENTNVVTYRFNLKNVNVEDMWTADDANIINNSIKIATLVITGRNVAGTIAITEIIDMEKSFIDNDGTETAAINTTAGADVDFEIGVPTKELTINVDLSSYRTKVANSAAFQNMTLVIEGEDIATKTVSLGDGVDGVDVANDVYTYKVALPENGLYKVSVSAPGYRAAHYEISMSTAKTLTFWNNHKTGLKAMEEYVDANGHDRVAGKTFSNFLAGDIVDDDIINEFDLSAVVSYFGETAENTNDAFAYIAYDINRDGKVDSKDVAIVLAGSGK